MAEAPSIHSIDNNAKILACTNRAAWGLITTAVLLMVSWSPTFYEMWLRWFPAWKMSVFTGWDRFVEGDSYFTHGPLVPVVSTFMVLVIYKRVGIMAQRTFSATLAGWLVFLFFVMTHLVSVYARVTFVSGYSLVGVLMGLLMMWGGWSLLRLYWIPVANLLFMVPIPMVWIADLNFTLKTTAVGCAVWLTSTIFHIPAIVDGSTVFLPSLPDGSPQFLIIENVCGGLRSLVSLTWFAALFVCFSRVQGKWRWLLLVISLPVAVICNILRVTFFCVIAHYFGVESIADDTLLHTLSGLFLFAGAIGVLFVVEKMIAELDRRYKLGFIGPSALLQLAHQNHSRSNRMRSTFNPSAPLPLIVLIIAAALGVGWSMPVAKMETGQYARKALPESLRLQGRLFTGVDQELDAGTLAILETSDYASRRFTSLDPQQKVDVTLIFSANNRKAIHPPEVCLQGGGVQIIQNNYITLAADEFLFASSRSEIKLRELITQQGYRRAYHLYTYKAAERYTPDFFEQQASIFLNGLLSRNAAGGLIRVSVPIHHENVDRSRQLALAVVRELLPRIERHWP